MVSDNIGPSWHTQLAVTLGLIAAAGLLGAVLYFALPAPAQFVGWPFG
jgi:hypothetical protein